MNRWILSSILILILSISVRATTWGESKAIDPISGDEISIYEIGSYGSYVYNWPSKYDAVYFPYTDEEYIRFSPKSGYIAFGKDFTEIDEPSKARVKEYLSKNYKRETQPKNHQEKLEWLKKIYEARGANEEFWLRYYCLQAYLNREDSQKSVIFRRKAVKIAKNHIKTLEPSFALAEAYFIIGSYSQMMADKEEADLSFNKMSSVSWPKNGEEISAKEAIEYFSKLVADLKSGKYLEKYIPKPLDKK